MSKQSFQTGFTKFMSGKGFYVALAVCLIGTGTAAWVAVDRTLTSIDRNNNDILGSSSEDRTWGFPTTEEAGIERDDVAISSEPSSSSSTPVSSSEPSSGQAASTEPSEPQEVPLSLAYILPIDGEIVNAYSGGKLIRDVTLGEWRTHNGIDFKAPKGSAVYSVAEGTVLGVYNDAMWGNTVEIEHPDGHVSVYCGLAKDGPVSEGDIVKLGQQIGVLDTVPAEISLAEHLHFGMKLDGQWVDPLAAMDKLK